jgi:hypothetical protein
MDMRWFWDVHYAWSIWVKKWLVMPFSVMPLNCAPVEFCRQGDRGVSGREQAVRHGLRCMSHGVMVHGFIL